jgi:Flp pilus assembly protein TadD
MTMVLANSPRRPAPKPRPPRAPIAASDKAQANLQIPPSLPTLRSLAEARGYARADLFALAEIGYHYLLSGGVELAETIFAGLAALAPGEAYFVLALGLCRDRMGRVEAAADCYRTARALDPQDARPELNLAELSLEAGDRAEAARLLRAALTRLAAHPQPAIERKARALLAAAVR